MIFWVDLFMIKNRCFVCGSYSLRADRALSGRLICTSCGNPYGVRKTRRHKINTNNLSFINSKRIIFVLLLILIFILII